MISSPTTHKGTHPDRIPCLICGRPGSELLCCIQAPRLIRLESEGRVQSYGPGQVIFHAATPPLALYCLCEGQVKIFTTAINGVVQILRLRGPGDLLGYRALLAGEPYAATAQAITEVKVVTIKAEHVHAVIRKSPGVASCFLRLLARDLRVSEENLVACTQLPVRRRTARFLLSLLGSALHPRKAGGTVSLKLPISRIEMAQVLSTTPETLSRALRSLAEKGVISVQGNQLVVRSVSGLVAAAGPDYHRRLSRKH